MTRPQDYDRTMERCAEKREWLISEYFGGRCALCGRTDATEWDIDHLLRETKEFELSGRMLDVSWERVLREAAKCQLLCRPCHQQKTRLDAPPRRHGTVRMRQEGCHCLTCEQAHSVRRERQREQRRAKRALASQDSNPEPAA